MNHENLTQQSQKQRDDDLSAKNGQTLGSSQKEAEDTASDAPDTGYLEPRDNMTIIEGPGSPIVTQMPNDNPDSQESGTELENGFVDPPGAGNASGNRPDARRDASPDQGSEFVEAD